MEPELAALHSAINSKHVAGIFDMQKAGERVRLATEIWTTEFAASMAELRAANSELTLVLTHQISNTTPGTEISVLHKERQIDGMLLNIVRGQVRGGRQSYGS